MNEDKKKFLHYRILLSTQIACTFELSLLVFAILAYKCLGVNFSINSLVPCGINSRENQLILILRCFTIFPSNIDVSQPFGYVREWC